ncbi:oligoalginate lyase [Pseudoxanthomonas wuyuanensis]|uniref:Alginate lyase n=1 Tax=Pseudoxanthomonas wuyuanensis TaxID=1073196 RepID=A0A286CX67_9GAMM|nr:oligoalginate lyase [Pseudoxanthomonas wuyuanensis]KAF1720842.1 alginate lyase [Pseudoxanthomonas wuyuanensis]SOD51006.1 Alginate lyase [Pseudoxanthomonas wuyuanensis]
MIRPACLAMLVSAGLGIAALPFALPAAAATSAPADQVAAEAAPVLVSAAQWRQMAQNGSRYPLFAHEQARAAEALRKAMAAGVVVPPPKDPGGGYSHEQHKRNYQAIHGAGALYRLTGERAYADYARDMLLAYAELYPTLGKHPAGRGQVPGRLFWQSLNDSVWLVHASQGYDAIRDTLSAAERRRIDEQVFRRMARFLSEQTPDSFNRIHNHATWAVAAVGMTGYVLRDQDMVDKALLGLSKDGKAGFLKQIDDLFSPDGYYEEGPYYQRYALAPFVIFANAIERNEPQRRIFAHKDGVLLKAVDTLVQSSYGGYFFPINDAILDKGLDTEELVAGIAVAYAQSGDAALLSIAERQRRTLLSPEGLQVAEALAAGRAKPFAFRPAMLRDGPDGDRGGLAILRAGGEDGQTLVMKNTSQGMGHGHFDKLNWLFYDNGQRVVTDYGAARFLNVEAKAGGIYLPENSSWAKQTVAHNTLAVNEQSHFGGDWKLGQRHAPAPLLFAVTGDLQIASARMQGAYDGVVFTRTLALLEHPELGLPVAIDLLRVQGSKPARYDLPLHFNGHIINVGFDAQRALATRPVLGKANGYQHLWVDASSEPSSEPRTLSWLLDGRFYSYRFGSSAPSRAILAESGANDPDFNLRREQALIQRVDGQPEVSFFAVLEPHGEYNGTAEYVRGASSRIRALHRVRGDDAEAIVLTLASGASVALAIADDPAPERRHRIAIGGKTRQWTGGYARFDMPAGEQASSGTENRTP